MDPDVLKEAIKDGLTPLCNAVRSISYGDNAGPLGLEGVAMALSGEGHHESIVGAIDRHAAAVEQVANAIENLASKLAAKP